MSNNLKPLSAQVADKLIQQFKDGNSIFQQNDGPPLMMPFNASSGKNYRGAPALVLLLKQEPDPRWMTLENGNFTKHNVMKDEKGTLISFYKTREMQPEMKDGQPVLKDNGKPKMVSVKLDESVLTNAFVFNAKQLKDMPALEPAKDQSERLATILGQEPDLRSVAEKVIAEKPNESSIKDALKANIATLFLSAELNQPFDLGDHVGYLEPWAQLLKEQPAELFKLANDAQYVADKVLGVEKKRASEQQAATTLNKGDVIPHKGDTITVLAILKGKVAQVQNSDGDKFKVSPKDGLYATLLKNKTAPQQQEAVIHEMKPQEEAQYARSI